MANETSRPLRWTVASLTDLAAIVLTPADVGFLAKVLEDAQLYQARSGGTGLAYWGLVVTNVPVASGVNWLALNMTTTGVNPTISAEGEANTGITLMNSEDEEIAIFNSVATSVSELTFSSAATGTNPIIAATGEANTGIDFENSEGEELFVMECVATAVSHIQTTNAATGTNPIITAAGEANTGIDFENSEGEELAIMECVATAVNEFTFSNAATGNGPQLEATGGDANINIEIMPKGTGYAIIAGGFVQETTTKTAHTDEGAGSSLILGETQVAVTAANADVNDFIVLPAIAGCPIGYTITIACNAGANFECRTPSSSGTKINNVDSDGTQELLMTDTTLVIIRKVSDTDGWQAVEYPLAGGVSAAVTPD